MFTEILNFTPFINILVITILEILTIVLKNIKKYASKLKYVLSNKFYFPNCPKIFRHHLDQINLTSVLKALPDKNQLRKRQNSTLFGSKCTYLDWLPLYFINPLILHITL